MAKVILIHANCYDPEAKGDFTFAANIAKDLIDELNSEPVQDINVTLISSSYGVTRFKEIYESSNEKQIIVEGKNITIIAINQLDPFSDTVIAFIDANRCKYSSAGLVKRILSPEGKILFVHNANSSDFLDINERFSYLAGVKKEQEKIYEFYNEKDLLTASAGFGLNRLGMPTIKKAQALPDLTGDEAHYLPKTDYGTLYLSSLKIDKSYQIISQYIRLTDLKHYVLVGNFNCYRDVIKAKCLIGGMIIQFHHSLPYPVLRKLVASGTAVLTATTGVASTLEAMQDRKLTYYQDSQDNALFVSSYLIAIKSIVMDDFLFKDNMPQMIIELTCLLFAEKPFNSKDLERTRALLNRQDLTSKTIEANQMLLEQASGKIAKRLLSFISSPRNTKNSDQLVEVCSLLRTPDEKIIPLEDEALRRAATQDKLFELKVLIASMPQSSLDRKNIISGKTAIQLAIENNSLDCVKALVTAGASLDIDDNEKIMRNKANDFSFKRREIVKIIDELFGRDRKSSCNLAF
jgi:hypothetical protein